MPLNSSQPQYMNTFLICGNPECSVLGSTLLDLACSPGTPHLGADDRQAGASCCKDNFIYPTLPYSSGVLLGKFCSFSMSVATFGNRDNNPRATGSFRELNERI